MQDGKTPLEVAVDEGHHRIVEYFIKQCGMEMSQFNEVCNTDPMFVCMCTVM